MSKNLKTGLFCVGLLLLSACTETVDSKNIRTAGIAALLRADATTDSATVVTATLKVGGASSNTYVDLAGGDRIFATGGDSRVEMQSQGAGKYEAEFNTAAADTEFLVDLQREEDDDAPASVGKLPGPFSMVVPNMTMSRAKDIVITWAPAGTNDAMTIELTGNCIFNRTIDVPGDPGMHTITGGTLVSVKADMPENCDVNVEMKRTRKGTADSIFDSESSFILTQTRTGTFTSEP